MITKAVDDSLHSALGEGETLLWQGPIGFNFWSSPVTVMVLILASGYAFWATWGSYLAADFCAGTVGRSCASLYWLSGPALLGAAAGQGFDMLERRALAKGIAKGAVLLTKRRLLRVSDWPWRRVRQYDYLASPPRWGFEGVIRFARAGSIILQPDHASYVRKRMADERKPIP